MSFYTRRLKREANSYRPSTKGEGEIATSANSSNYMMKLNNKQGMPIKWDTIKKVKIQKDGFLFKLNIVQFIIFPFKVFNNENEIRFLRSILNRKGYV